MNNDHIYEVVQVGYGPVGQVNAALLGLYGHSVAVFERHSGLYALPRAGHVDHEIVRIFQTIDAADGVLEDAFRCANYGWRNQHGESLIDIDWSQEGISGWASDYLFYQPYLESALDAAARSHSKVSINHGWEAVDLKTHEDHVEVTFAKGKLNAAGEYVHSGERQSVRGRYLIGADGANSFTRQSAEIELQDLGFREQWLVTDFRQKRPLSFDFDNGQICDPARPLCLFQLGKTHRRFEFMVLPGEDPVQLASPECVWSLVSKWITPEDAELIRSTVYTFRSAIARHWRSGRILIAGDAAHLMPPFLGQGMCSGVRDVANLAWKLDLVLRGLANDDLLDTYMTERKPHVGAIIEQAVALGKVSCTIDPEAARQRDEAFFSGQIPPPPPFPWITEGILHEAQRMLNGRLGPQALVEFAGSRGLADNIVGKGWQLICKAGTCSAVNNTTRAAFKALNIHVLELDECDGIRDIDGVYTKYLDDAHADAVLVRPDFYVFGAADEYNSVDDLVAALVRMVLPRLSTTTELRAAQ